MKRDTIIIFEDNAIDRSILVELFRSEYKILEAENGKVGIELLKNNLASVAIVLLDNVMPVMDGFAVLEYLKKRNIVNKIPFIMIRGLLAATGKKGLRVRDRELCEEAVSAGGCKAGSTECDRLVPIQNAAGADGQEAEYQYPEAEQCSAAADQEAEPRE